MHCCDPKTRNGGRREFLKTASTGFGYLAFSALATLARESAAAAGPLQPKPPHLTPKARRVIFLYMSGAPSHVDLFDHKPRLTRDTGSPSGRARLGLARLLGSPWQFKQHGKSGQWISELLPALAGCADDLCVVRSMQTNVPAHSPASIFMHTGSSQFIRPSLGAWTLYGLGAAGENVPGFVTLSPNPVIGGAQNYGSAFLPAIYQGTPIGEFSPFNRGGGARMSLANAANARLTKAKQREQLDLVQSLNRSRLAKDEVNPQIEGVIESYELAFRMQAEVPALMELEQESEATRRLYGMDDPVTEPFGRQCLLARRFIEAGVRFVEVGHGNWDDHRNLSTDLPRHCAEVDRPIAGLLKDLKARGLLDETLVLWGGEFGRTPHAQGGDGRDHSHTGFTVWMAGGGVRAGLSHGQTDDYGYEAVADPVGIHDLHATVLRLLGLDHRRLTYRYAGRDFRLTDVHGNVAEALIA